MLKSDLVQALVEDRKITQKQAEAAVETIFDAMRDALRKGENIEIRGFGAFHVKEYKGYQGRNPKTGEVIPVSPKRGILFRTGKELRERINSPIQAAGEAAAKIREDGEPIRPRLRIVANDEG
jgi:integration host factor subunit beta